MTYDIWLTPTAKGILDAASTETREQYQNIRDVLTENPYPRPAILAIQDATLYGRTFYTYLDPAFPYVLRYVVQEIRGPDEGFVYGLVTISLISDPAPHAGRV